MLNKLLLLLFISSCSLSFDRDIKNDKIIIEELEPIQNNKVDCNMNTLTKLELIKCQMEARLLELKY